MSGQTVKISDVKSNPNNPRLIKDDKFLKLVQSLKEFPEMAKVRPIVVNQDFVVLGGNMRLKAMKEAGWKEVPVEVVDWSEEKQREFIVKDNVGFGEWDWEILANEWDAEDLEKWGLDVPGFEEAPEAEEDDYEIPDVIETDIVIGDLFEIGEHRLLCGDSTDSDQVAKLMNGEKADMVFTDPPYNLGDIIKSDTFITENKKAISNENWDKGFDISSIVPTIDIFTNKNSSVYIFTSQYLFGDIVSLAKLISDNVQFCVWIKRNPQPNMGKRYFTQSCELCVFFTKGKHIFNFTEEGHDYNFWEFNNIL